MIMTMTLQILVVVQQKEGGSFGAIPFNATNAHFVCVLHMSWSLPFNQAISLHEDDERRKRETEYKSLVFP
jgi:hypothetical protein